MKPMHNETDLVQPITNRPLFGFLGHKIRDLIPFRKRPSNGLEFARRELEAAKLFSKESDYEGMIGEAVMDLMETFTKQGHSGFSAQLTIDIFTKLACFKPLTPLTGEDDEWFEPYLQNKRCSSVFKEGDKVYDIDGIVFSDENGATYTCYESRVPVTFPYTPHTEYVNMTVEEWKEKNGH